MHGDSEVSRRSEHVSGLATSRRQGGAAGRRRGDAACRRRGDAACGRWHGYWATALGMAGALVALPGCSLFLEAPPAFTVNAGDLVVVTDAASDGGDAFVEDQFVRRDAFRVPDARDSDRLLLPDTMPADRPQVPPDRPPPPDVPDLGPDALPPPPPDMFVPPDACVPGTEVCDGIDNDCDDAVDEADPADCAPCGVEGREGLCALGAMACVDAALRCVPWLPAEGTGDACNGRDDDCDGLIDEAGDRSPAPEPGDAALVAHCGEPPDVPLTEPPCPDGSLGCGENPVHVCVDAVCRVECTDSRAGARALCGDGCAAGEPERGVCVRDCLDQAEVAFAGCLTVCAAIDRGGASRWTCAEGPAGPVCAATACPPDFRPRRDGCVPNVEVCNNGLDDDGDGLVDGTLTGTDPCAVQFDLRGALVQMGRCNMAADGPCEDSAWMSRHESAGDETVSLDQPIPRMVDLSYRFAVDKEEISIRAYAECVAAGCCLTPRNQVYQSAMQVLAANPDNERPDAPDGCAPWVDPGSGAHQELLPDLPVTGVSWCMARDYCNWLGKRMPTELEWEHTAAGAGPRNEGRRHNFPWGNEPPPNCVEEQCCRAEDFAGQLPATCTSHGVNDASDLSVCRGEPAGPGGSRSACLGVYNGSDTTCSEVISAPAPSYANVDGATPEGALNMAGNVEEWVYDWPTDSLADLATTDPVGAGCDITAFAPKRTVRGRTFASQPYQTRGLNRTVMWTSARAPTIGFRCARTLTDDDTLCDPHMPHVNREQCLPGADAVAGTPGRDDLPACPAPDFDNQDPTDLLRCGGAPRAHSVLCDEGLTDFCPTETVVSGEAGCGAFVLTKLELPVGLLGDSDAVGLLNAVFAASLKPAGGSTLITIGLPDDFDLQAANWRASFGSADIDADGRLVRLGVNDQGICRETDHGVFTVQTVDQVRNLTPVCRAVVHSELWLREAPLSLAFSAFSMEAAYEPANETLRGTLVLVMNYGDLTRARIGTSGTDPDVVQQVLDRIGAGAMTLCGLPLGVNCFAQPLTMPGCNLQYQCDTPETCMGWGLPFSFEATRADRLGLRGLSACPAP